MPEYHHMELREDPGWFQAGRRERASTYFQFLL